MEDLSRMDATTQAPVEVIILGAGPAGLTAGLFLARFNIKTLLLEAFHMSPEGETQGPGRSQTPGVYNNVPAFPGGIDREELKWRGIQQAQQAGCDYRIDEALAVEVGADGHFRISCRTGCYVARRVVAALGVQDVWPELPELKHWAGRLLFWSVDVNGFEAMGKPAAVLGKSTQAAQEALKLTRYSPQVSLVVQETTPAWGPATQQLLDQYHVRVRLAPIKSVQQTEHGIQGLILADNTVVECQMIFSPSQPRKPRSQILAALGARCDARGYVWVDNAFRTNIPNLYAIGDITARGPELAVTSMYQGMQVAWAIYQELVTETFSGWTDAAQEAHTLPPPTPIRR